VDQNPTSTISSLHQNSTSTISSFPLLNIKSTLQINQSTQNTPLKPTFDVWRLKSNFKMKAPPRPDYVVMVFSTDHPPPTMSQVCQLNDQYTQSILCDPLAIQQKTTKNQYHKSKLVQQEKDSPSTKLKFSIYSAGEISFLSFDQLIL